MYKQRTAFGNEVSTTLLLRRSADVAVPERERLSSLPPAALYTDERRIYRRTGVSSTTVRKRLTGPAAGRLYRSSA